MDKKSEELFEKAIKASRSQAETHFIKLVKVVSGKNAHYSVEGMPKYYVMRRETYFNRGDGLKGTYVDYYAIDRDSGVYVAHGSTLKELKKFLARYLSDLSQETLGPASRYGHHGKNKPIQSMTDIY